MYVGVRSEDQAVFSSADVVCARLEHYSSVICYSRNRGVRVVGYFSVVNCNRTVDVVLFGMICYE